MIAAGLFFIAGCGALGQIAQIVQPSRFERADRPADIRFIASSLSNPAGGAGVTLWIQVTNPKPFGVKLSTLAATLHVEGQRAATGDFPLGLPLTANQTSVIPLDLSISFTDVPGLAGAIRQAATGQPIGYELNATVGIDAGRFGQQPSGRCS